MLATLCGLSGMLGAGLLLGLSPAAAAGGWWLLAGPPIAAVIVLAVSTTATPSWIATDAHGAPRPPADHPEAPGGAPGGGWFAECAGLAVRALAGAAVLGAVTLYLAPGTPVLAAGMLVIIAGARAAGVTVARVLVCGSVVAALACCVVFVLACFAIEPVAPAGAVAGAVNDPLGGLRAAGILLIALLGCAGPVRVARRAIVSAAGICLAVAGAALYQLGPARLGLAHAPLLDALAAADAGSLRPFVFALVVCAALPTLYWLIGGMERTGRALGVPGTSRSLSLAAALLVLLCGLVLPPHRALLVAACVALGGCAWVLMRGVRWRCSVLAGPALVGTAGVAAAMPFWALAVAAGVLVACGLISVTAYRAGKTVRFARD